jgi:hypothetical protein
MRGLLCVVVGVGSMSAVGCSAEIAPDRFVVGVSAEREGLRFDVVDCLGGELRAVELMTLAGSNDSVWRTSRDGGESVFLAAGEPFYVTTAKAPGTGWETTPYTPPDVAARLRVTFETSEQGYAQFFSLSDLSPGKVWTDAGTLSDPEGFRDELNDYC